MQSEFEAGTQIRRIYCLVGTDVAAVPRHRFGTPGELGRALGSRDGWTRETARRLIIERQATELTSVLVDLAQRSEWPEVRCAVLWTLRSLGTLTVPAISMAFEDRSP